MIAFALLILTLAGVMSRPRGVSEWIIAVVGAAAMLAVGALTPAEALQTLAAQWNVLMFFLGLMATAAVAEQSGVLAWLTGAAYRVARGRQDILFLLVCALCVAVTATLSNDATILLLTPLLVRMVMAVGAPVLPYALACAFLANGASAVLPIANPTNVIVLEGHPLVLSEYVHHLLLPSCVAILATVGTLFLMHRSALSTPLVERRHERRPPPRGAPAFALGLVAVLTAYLVALEVAVPIGPVAVVGGAALTSALLLGHRLHPRTFAADIEWGIFPFFAGLVVVVAGASRAGLVDTAATIIQELGANVMTGPILVGIASALAANAMNNLPAAVLLSAALERGATADHTITAAVLVGIDVGPSFTTLGSLATLMWLVILRRRGIAISSLDYLRWSFAPSLAALAASLAVLSLFR
ncbi:MAG TPA: SLC13 family permease [Candidatus Limnocylindria bacterium]|nr:SLC13 family permease [Candidatus Limnocylindria bacterium]